MDKILGVDIGSLTIKAAVYDPCQKQAQELSVFSHGRQPLRKTVPLLAKWMSEPEISRIAFTGVMGKELTEFLDCYYVNPLLL